MLNFMRTRIDLRETVLLCFYTMYSFRCANISLQLGVPLIFYVEKAETFYFFNYAISAFYSGDPIFYRNVVHGYFCLKKHIFENIFQECNKEPCNCEGIKGALGAIGPNGVPGQEGAPGDTGYDGTVHASFAMIFFRAAHFSTVVKRSMFLNGKIL